MGYATNARLTQTPAAMSLTSDALRSAVSHIERLASHDNGFFEVYLFELKSVTMAHTQAIVRNFRNRPGDYLLVLTNDYEQLDFVLVERISPEATKSQSGTGPLNSSSSKQVSVRPRILTVTRRNPSEVAMRVLRRFSYTEADTFAQYDKLISAYDIADWSEPFFNNRALFSDYYLTKRLPHEPAWPARSTAATPMTRAFQQLRQLFAGVREEFSNQPEAVIRQKLLEPVLAVLGFVAKAGKSGNSVALEPDYLLSALSPALQSEKPLAICLTYTWSRNLDGKDEQRDSQTPDENPGAMVVALLDRGDAEWAIVTNGKTWRLYSAKAHSRATNYYEIDLEETLALPPEKLAEAFPYFWLFFRAEAFSPLAASGLSIISPVESATGLAPAFLDRLVAESERYARELGERLKERIFEEIFPHFARGFILYARQHGQLPANFEAITGEERSRLLEPFFSGTLTFLYRLLFLLYAESRDLLPVRETRGYYEKSLEKLKQRVAGKAAKIEDEAPGKLRLAFNDLSTELYDALQELFGAVDRGDAALNVPVYNGGLFITRPDPADPSTEAATARFLLEHKITDRQLALGLNRMTRDVDEKRHDLAMIDYKSLGVRQLGSIYEGLLEFKLRVAPEVMAVVRGKKTEEIMPLAEATAKKLPLAKEGRGKEARDKQIARGEVYLENDRRERKATGSYYTPDYIVKYIVENTVGPVLKEKLEALRPAFRQAELTLLAEKQKAAALSKQGRSGDTPENQAYLKHPAVSAAFFDLKVLDPAMGSGHFLVEAVDYITDRMADFLTGFRWNPVIHELTATRRDIQAEMERQGVTIDAGKLIDLNLLKRHVLKQCIYGVDLNPMAVELAKVSLWLDCFTLGAPLSFLDHHMKAGNSLIGGNVAEVQEALSRDMFGNQFAGLLSATSLMQQVGNLSDITVEEVTTSQSAYRQAFDALAPFKRLLDVWISEHFGNKGAQHAASTYTQAIVQDRTSEVKNPADRARLETALALATTKRFFHWELEFPEVFYNQTRRRPDGGFDAVIGNPPYVRQEGLGEDKVIFQKSYVVFNSIADLYTYFIERGHNLVRAGGRYSMITANKFMRANYGAALRSFLTNRKGIKLEKLIDFGDLPVFGEATTYPIIIVSTIAERGTAPIEYALIKNLDFENLNTAIKSNSANLPESAFAGTNWSLAATSHQAVLDKLKVLSLPLGQYVKGEIKYGIKTGFNEAFYIDKATRDQLIADDPKSTEIIKPLLVGEDVKRYGIEYVNRYLIFTRRGLDISKYKAIERYLSQFRTQLEPKPSGWNITTQGEWPGRKPGPYKWFEIQDNVAYFADFEKPKIVYPNICIKPEFTFDTEGYYSNQKTFIIPLDDKYLLSILSSKIMHFLFESTIPKLRGGYFEPGHVFMKDMPIRKINFPTPSADRERLSEELKGLYQTELES